MKYLKTAGMKKYAKAMGNVCSALSIVYVLAALINTDPSVFQGLDWRLCLPVCAAGVALKSITVWMSARAWCLWLECYAQKRCSRKEAFRVYARANIGKYLPGNVMHYVERNLFAGKLHLSQKQITAASLSEVAGLILAAFFIGILFGFEQVRQVFFALLKKMPFLRVMQENFFKRIKLDEGFPSAGNMSWMAGWGIGLPGVILAVCVIRWMQGIQGKRYFAARRFWNTFLLNLAIYAAVLVILGFILVPVCWCLGKRPDLQKAMQIIAAYTIAWVFGFVVPGAPGGIGVREMALILLLTPVMGREFVGVSGTLHRLITIAGDAAVYLLWGRRQKQRKSL